MGLNIVHTVLFAYHFGEMKNINAFFKQKRLAAFSLGKWAHNIIVMQTIRNCSFQIFFTYPQKLCALLDVTNQD